MNDNREITAMVLPLLQWAADYTPGVRAAPDARIGMLRRSHHIDDSFILSRRHIPDGWQRDETIESFRTALTRSELWWVSGEMVDLIETAATSLPEQEMRPGDEPALNGLVVYGKSIRDEAGPEEPYPYIYTNAMLWFASVNPLTGLMAMTIVSLAWMGTALGWFVAGSEDWAVGETQSGGDADSDKADRARIATLWTLAQQKRITRAPIVHPDRAAARRLRAAGLPPEMGSVRCLDLRRPSGSSTGDGTTNYSRRWMVNGHWRNQWLPSRQTHRAQWITPYIKGPEDKPLVIRDDVRVVQ